MRSLGLKKILARTPNQNPYQTNNLKSNSRSHRSKNSSKGSLRSSRSSNASQRSMMSLERLSNNQILLYLERKYVFSGKVQGNLVAQLKGQTPDIESLQSPSNLKNIRDEVQIHYGRKSNEIEALSIYRDELLLIQQMNKSKYEKNKSPFQLPIESSKTLKKISTTENLHKKGKASQINKLKNTLVTNQKNQAFNPNTFKISISILRAKANAEQQMVQKTIKMKEEIQLLQQEEQIMNKYIAYTQNQDAKSSRASDTIDLVEQAQLMKNNLNNQIQFLLKDLDITNQQNAKEIKKMQRQILNLRIGIKEKEQKMKIISKKNCQMGIRRSRVDKNHKQKKIQSVDILCSKNHAITNLNIVRDLDENPSQNSPKEVKERKLCQIEWIVTKKEKTFIKGFKCYYQTSHGGLMQQGKLFIVKNSFLTNQSSLSFRISEQLQKERSSVNHKQICQYPSNFSFKPIISEGDSSDLQYEEKSMKVKDLKEIQFYFDVKKNVIKGILAVYNVNPILQRTGKLSNPNGIQNMCIIGECSLDEDTIRERFECGDKNITGIGALWKPSSINEEKEDQSSFAGISVYFIKKPLLANRNSRSRSRSRGSSLSQRSGSGVSQQSIGKKKFNLQNSRKNPISKVISHHKIASNQYCV